MQRRIADDFIESPVREVGLGVEEAAVEEAEGRGGGAVVVGGGGDEGRGGVDADDGGDMWQVVGGEFGVAAADVEDVVCGLRGEVLEDFLREARDEGGGGGVGCGGPVVSWLCGCHG